MDTWNFSFLLLVSFLAISIVGVAMLPLDGCRPEPSLSPDGPPDLVGPEPGVLMPRLELASLYLQELEARNWKKLTVCLAAPTPSLAGKASRGPDLPRFSHR
ncbi:MAG TPA: hypothetical protein VGD78_13790 [Chthoniobacterales bacterium]